MLRNWSIAFGFLISIVGVSETALAQGPPNPEKMIAAQREAMKRFAFMDGVWRGPAWTILPSGDKTTVTQTERIGPFLDGSVKVIEGRGYDGGGAVKFNAFGTISYNLDTHAYTFHAYAQGSVGDFVFTPTADGYIWEIPAGPEKIRYTATVKDGTLREVGDRIVSGKEPFRFFEMNLKRVGNTDWPAAGAIPPQ
jgi:hypothetical protein